MNPHYISPYAAVESLLDDFQLDTGNLKFYQDLEDMVAMRMPLYRTIQTSVLPFRYIAHHLVLHMDPAIHGHQPFVTIPLFPGPPAPQMGEFVFAVRVGGANTTASSAAGFLGIVSLFVEHQPVVVDDPQSAAPSDGYGGYGGYDKDVEVDVDDKIAHDHDHDHDHESIILHSFRVRINKVEWIFGGRPLFRPFQGEIRNERHRYEDDHDPSLILTFIDLQEKKHTEDLHNKVDAINVEIFCAHISDYGLIHEIYSSPHERFFGYKARPSFAGGAAAPVPAPGSTMTRSPAWG
jgi:hypothetical protein